MYGYPESSLNLYRDGNLNMFSFFLMFALILLEIFSQDVCASTYWGWYFIEIQCRRLAVQVHLKTIVNMR